jgi:hypothetical protein
LAAQGAALPLFVAITILVGEKPADLPVVLPSKFKSPSAEIASCNCENATGHEILVIVWPDEG